MQYKLHSSSMTLPSSRESSKNCATYTSDFLFPLSHFQHSQRAGRISQHPTSLFRLSHFPFFLHILRQTFSTFFFLFHLFHFLRVLRFLTTLSHDLTSPISDRSFAFSFFHPSPLSTSSYSSSYSPSLLTLYVSPPPAFGPKVYFWQPPEALSEGDPFQLAEEGKHGFPSAYGRVRAASGRAKRMRFYDRLLKKVILVLDRRRYHFHSTQPNQTLIDLSHTPFPFSHVSSSLLSTPSSHSLHLIPLCPKVYLFFLDNPPKPFFPSLSEGNATSLAAEGKHGFPSACGRARAASGRAKRMRIFFPSEGERYKLADARNG